MSDELTGDYLAHCAAERVPPNTVARRRAVLSSLGSAGTASREQVEAWWATRRTLSPATRSNDLACLRSFYRWAQRWEHRADDPTLRLDAPKVARGLPRPLGRADLYRLLDTLPADLRRAVILNGKGGRSRVVALGARLLDGLLPDTGGNVVTGTDEAYTAAQLQRRVNRAMRAAGVAGTFHALRHRYGTLAYQETRDLVAVGRQMGHSSPVTTAIYAAAADDVADEIAAAVAR